MPESNSFEIAPDVQAVIEKILDAMWQSVEDAEIAVSDGLHALTKSSLSGEKLTSSQSLLLLFRCLVNLRKRGFFTDEQDEFFSYLEESVKENRTLSNFASVLASVAKRRDLSVEDARNKSAVERSDGHSWLSVIIDDYITQIIVNDQRIVDKKSELEEILERYDVNSREGVYIRLRIIGSTTTLGSKSKVDIPLLRQLRPIAVASVRNWAMYRLVEVFFEALFGDDDDWLTELDDAVEIVRSYGSEGYLCSVVGNLSNLCRAKGVTVPAIRLARMGLEIATRIGSVTQINLFNNLLIWSYDEVGLPELARETGIESEKRLREQGPSLDLFNVYLVNGKILSRVGQFDESMIRFDMALDLSSDLADSQMQRAQALTFKSHAFTRFEKPELAYPLLMEASQIVDTLLMNSDGQNNEHLLMKTNISWALARTHHQLEEYPKAIEYYLKVKSHVNLNTSDESLELLRYLADCYYHIGESDDSLKTYREYIAEQRNVNAGEQQQEIIRGEIERTIEQERQRSERERTLLHSILPSAIADRRLAGERRIADTIDDVAVLFVDIAGFTPKASELTAHELIVYLEEIFTPIEEIVKEHGGEKIKTIGDAFMGACGATTEVDRGAERMVRAALEISARHGDKVRIGIHQGQVVAGVLGQGRFTFDLWGDAVNVAARLESHGEPGKIHVSGKIAKQMANADGVKVESRGEIDVKGKGRMETFWVSTR